MEQALSDFAAIISALDQRIAALERKCDMCCAPAPVVETIAETTVETIAETTVETIAETIAETTAETIATPTSPSEKPTITVGDGEVLVNLDEFSPDTIQNELWRTFCSISAAGNTAVVTYTGDYPRNIITYDDLTSVAKYRNAGAAEMRVIRAIEGTLLLTLKPGEMGQLSYSDGRWWECVD